MARLGSKKGSEGSMVWFNFKGGYTIEPSDLESMIYGQFGPKPFEVVVNSFECGREGWNYMFRLVDDDKEYGLGGPWNSGGTGIGRCHPA